METLGATPGAAALSPEERVALLQEWSQSAPSGTAVPSRLHWLLRAADLPGFRGLARVSSVEPQFVGLAACFALSGSAGWEPGPGVLKGLSDDQLQAVVSELASLPDRAAVHERLRSQVESAKILVDWLLRTGTRLPPDRVEELLSESRCDQLLGHEFWLEDKHLEGVLDRLATDSPFSRRLWAKLVARITAASFDESAVSAEISTLAAARDRYPGSLAPEDLRRLDSWNTLGLQFSKPPKTPPPGTAAKLRSACDAVGQTPEALIGQWFSKWVMRAPDDLERKRKNEVLGAALLGFYETEDAACAAAMELTREAKDPELRRGCKTDLFSSIVSDASHNRLAAKHEDELRGTSIHPRLSPREPVRSKARGQKGLGVGSHRLPPEATPYVGHLRGGSRLRNPPRVAPVAGDFRGRRLHHGALEAQSGAQSRRTRSERTGRRSRSTCAEGAEARGNPDQSRES